MTPSRAVIVRTPSPVPGLYLFSHPLAGQPFGTALELCLILLVLAWVVSLVTGDCAVLPDRLWSLSPPVYCLLVAVAGDFDVVRVNRMTALVVLWGQGSLTISPARAVSGSVARTTAGA